MRGAVGMCSYSVLLCLGANRRPNVASNPCANADNGAGVAAVKGSKDPANQDSQVLAWRRCSHYGARLRLSLWPLDQKNVD